MMAAYALLERRPWLGYPFAVLATFSAAALRAFLLHPLGHHAPYLTFYPVVMLSALFCGFPAGIVSTALSALLASCFFIAPVHALAISDAAEMLGFVVFVLTGLIIAYLSSLQRRVQLLAIKMEMELASQIERTRVAVDLAKSDERLRLALAASKMGVWEWQLATNQVHWSPECYELVGLPDFDGNFATFGKLLHPEDASRVQGTVARVLAEGGEYRDEFRIVGIDGVVRWLSNRGKVCYDEKGQPVRLIGTVQDVSGRMEVERELRESEEHHRSILKTAMDGIVLLDGTGRFLEVNESYLAMSGYSERELLAMSISQLEAGDSPGELTARPGGILARRQDRFESRHRRKDGSCFDVEISVQCLDSKEALLVVFVHDISARKRHEEERKGLEAQLHQAQKLESVGRLAGGVAHDFNNMLSVIIGHAGMALTTQGLSPQLKTNLIEIEKAAERSADLTRQLLAFARRQTIEPRVLDLNRAVSGMLKMLQRLIGENVQLAWKPAPSLWRVKLDPSQVDQILANLCVNARDSIAAVGHIAIETANCPVDDAYCEEHPLLAPGQYVRLSVTDDGCGIEEQFLEQIFEPFYTTKEVGKGTGLGLSTVYGIVKQNSGFIEVESAAGRGSTFTVYLARHEEEHLQPLSPEAAADLPRGQATILLVEDEPAILQVTSALLASLGYRVLTACTPAAALKQAQLHAGEIDLLLSDVVMPEMDGLELARRLKETRPRTRSLFMSGYTSDVIGHHGVLGQELNFIHKPFSLPVLAAKVTEVLTGAR